MYIQRKWFYLYYTLSFFLYQNLINLGSYLLIMKIFSQYSINMSDKNMFEDSQTQSPLRFLPKCKPKKCIV